MMIKFFWPDLYIKDIYQLDLKFIKSKKIKGLLIDLDNTLLPWNSNHVDDKLRNWIQACKDESIALCIISNNKARRINFCSERLDIPAVTGAVKPGKAAFLRGLKILGVKPDQAAVVGDQIFTDIFGAKRLGMFAILVKPISDREFFWTRLMRRFERIVLRIMEKNTHNMNNKTT